MVCGCQSYPYLDFNFMFLRRQPVYYVSISQELKILVPVKEIN